MLPCTLASGVSWLRGVTSPWFGVFGARLLSGTFLKPPLQDGARGASLGEAFRRNRVFFLFLVKCFVSDRLLMSSILFVIWGPQRKDAGYFESKERRRFS